MFRNRVERCVKAARRVETFSSFRIKSESFVEPVPLDDEGPQGFSG